MLLAYINRQLLVRVIFWTRPAGPSAFKGQRPRQGQSMRYAAPWVSGPITLISGRDIQAIFRRRHQPRRPPLAKIRPGRTAAKAWENENRPQLSLTGPRLAQLLQVLIGLLRPQRVERLRPLRGLRAWLDRLPIILSVNAWSVVAASVHSRASLRYSSRCRVSSVSSAALTQFSAWYS